MANEQLKKALDYFDVKCPKCRTHLSWGGILKGGFIRCADCKTECILEAKEIKFSKDGKSYRVVN